MAPDIINCVCKRMKIQPSVIVPLGYGKYVKSDRVTAVVPIEDERGPGRRTFVYAAPSFTPHLRLRRRYERAARGFARRRIARARFGAGAARRDARPPATGNLARFARRPGNGQRHLGTVNATWERSTPPGNGQRHLGTVNATVRDIVRDRSQLDFNLLERRLRDALDESGE